MNDNIDYSKHPFSFRLVAYFWASIFAIVILVTIAGVRVAGAAAISMASAACWLDAGQRMGHHERDR